MGDYSDNKAGTLALIVSFLCPIAGVVIYFINKDEVENPSAYLVAAGGGAIFGFVIGLGI